MKKILLIGYLLIAVNASAQQYVPFPTANAVWRENGINLSGLTSHQFFFYQISISKDTVINAVTYHELQEEGTAYENSYFNGSWHYHNPYGLTFHCNGAMREDSIKRIYFYDYISSAESLLYDFNLSIGDTLPVTMINEWRNNIVSGIDSIEINGIYHRRYLIADTSYNQPFAAYIEGVGSTMGLLGGELRFTGLPLEVYSWLICFSENGVSTMIDSMSSQADCDLLNATPSVSKSENFALFPNPTTGKLKILTVENIESVSIFNLLGEKVFVAKQESVIDIAGLPAGIYMLVATSTDEVYRASVIKE